jgi:hypothetical protein
MVGQRIRVCILPALTSLVRSSFKGAAPKDEGSSKVSREQSLKSLRVAGADGVVGRFPFKGKSWRWAPSLAEFA